MGHLWGLIWTSKGTRKIIAAYFVDKIIENEASVNMENLKQFLGVIQCLYQGLVQLLRNWISLRNNQFNVIHYVIILLGYYVIEIHNLSA